ncbi:MAG TPA: hypothetical protein VFE87_00710 [Candidatus Paceibacterota bacterium]|nr:hypothetical protein [Candidatus Paceibacterota bacterium]
MKKIVGVLVIASVITLGAYFYFKTGGIQAKGDSPAAATVSEPIKAQPEVKKTQEETEKPAPELKSFEGLDQESSVIFNGDGGSQSSSEDPLKEATQ